MSAEIRTKIRAWVTPITVMAFLLLAGSGFLMEADQKGLRGFHETIAYVFCAIAIAHVALNWRLLVTQMKTAKAIMAVAIVGVLSSMIWIGTIRQGHDQQSSKGSRQGELTSRDATRGATHRAHNARSSD